MFTFHQNDNTSMNFICDDDVYLNQKGTHNLASNCVTFINSVFNFN